jgi:hypothetical protein
VGGGLAAGADHPGGAPTAARGGGLTADDAERADEGLVTPKPSPGVGMAKARAGSARPGGGATAFLEAGKGPGAAPRCASDVAIAIWARMVERSLALGSATATSRPAR